MEPRTEDPLSTPVHTREVVLFFVLATAITWALWLPLLVEKLTGDDLPTVPLQFFLASFGPALAALGVTARRGRPAVVSWLRRAFAVAGLGRALAAVGAMVVGYWVLGFGVAAVQAGAWPSWAELGLTAKLPGWPAPAVLAVWLLTFGLGEELGWRGWLLPALRTRASRIASALAVTAVWAAWHLPAFFFNPTYLAMGWSVVGWLLGLTAGSLLLASITESARWSVVPVIVWHGGFDLLTAADQSAGTIAAVISTVVMLQGAWAARQLWRRDRAEA